MTIQRNSKKKRAAASPLSSRRLNLLILLSLVQVLLLVWFIWFAVTGGGFWQDSNEGSSRHAATAIQPQQTSSSPPVTQPAELEVDVSPPETASEEAATAEVTTPPMQTPVRIEVLNGTGVARLAWRFSQRLIEQGIDVRETTNADRHNYALTRVICRSTDLRQALHLAKLLGLPVERVEQIASPDLVDIDVTLILGADYRQFEP